MRKKTLNKEHDAMKRFEGAIMEGKKSYSKSMKGGKENEKINFSV